MSSESNQSPASHSDSPSEYGLRSKGVNRSIRAVRSSSANSVKSSKKKQTSESVISEKTVVSLSDVLRRADEVINMVNASDADYVVFDTKHDGVPLKDAREPFLHKKKKPTTEEEMQKLKAELKVIQGKIEALKLKSKAQSQKKKNTCLRPLNWTYDSNYIRHRCFDERVKRNGQPAANPRVVVIVYTHNRDNGVTNYAATIWTQGHRSDMFNKAEQIKIATDRLTQAPITLRMHPVPKSNAEVENCLRWAVHEYGVTSDSHKFMAFKRRRESTLHYAKMRDESKQRQQSKSTEVESDDSQGPDL